jgi:myo-inositol catabolism protein IolC
LWPATDSFAELAPLTGQGVWIARALPPTSGFAGGIKLMAEIRRWPREHILWLDKLAARDTDKVVALAEVAAETRHEILIDLSGDENALATAQAVVAAGVRPEWWMLADAEPALEAWIAALDIPSRGVILRDQALLPTI